MRSAPCAWAPSHTLHAMPPRITRNSHRPRASDRTMVDLEHQFGLPLFRTRWHRHHPRRKLMSMGNRPSFSREAQLQWAGSRETNLASGRGRTFFLTSLFIELIDSERSQNYTCLYECHLPDLKTAIHYARNRLWIQLMPFRFVGILTTTFVPLRSDWISTDPPNSRMRSRIPAIPTPTSRAPSMRRFRRFFGIP